MSLFAAGGRRSLLGLQVALGSLLVVVTALLGNALFDARTGFVAGLLAALYPTFIAYSHYLWSETLFAVLVTGAFLGVMRARRRPCRILAAATGLCFGAAALTREIAIPIAAASALWWACTAPRGLRRQAAGLGATMLACAALVVLPWTYRNYTAFGRLVPVATVGWFAAAEGNTWEAPTWLRGGGPRQREFYRGYYARPAEIERLEFARRHAIERVRAEQPTWIFKKLARTVVQLLGPDGSLRQKTRAGVYRDLSPALVQALLAGSYLYSALLVAAGAWGIAGARGGGRRLLPGLVLGGSRRDPRRRQRDLSFPAALDAATDCIREPRPARVAPHPTGPRLGSIGVTDLANPIRRILANRRGPGGAADCGTSIRWPPPAT